ncbi:unnamed protein product [marine sediment metagenome]|jgi:hypothetical protein|uniref:Uncharacterized protein n=1 Tax=marine sediment metagenome TaxID=412755 RepID=X1IQC6_9ZZZZ
MKSFSIGIGAGVAAKTEITLPTGISGVFRSLCDPCSYIAVAAAGAAETQQALTVETSYEDTDIAANEIALSPAGDKIKLGDDLTTTGAGGVVLTISGIPYVEGYPEP